MTNILVWCMMTVSFDNELVNTALKGRIIDSYTRDYDKMLVVDFSEYIIQKGYNLNYSHKNWHIPKYLCTEEK